MIYPIEREDLIQINSWYQKRELQHPPLELTPPAGLIWKNVAAGYLIKTDAGICFLEHYITNPDANRKLREVALEKITEQFLVSALAQGFIGVYALSNHVSIGKLALKLGFEQTTSYNSFVFRR